METLRLQWPFQCNLLFALIRGAARDFHKFVEKMQKNLEFSDVQSLHCHNNFLATIYKPKKKAIPFTMWTLSITALCLLYFKLSPLFIIGLHGFRITQIWRFSPKKIASLYCITVIVSRKDKPSSCSCHWSLHVRNFSSSHVFITFDPPPNTNLSFFYCGLKKSPQPTLLAISRVLGKIILPKSIDKSSLTNQNLFPLELEEEYFKRWPPAAFASVFDCQLKPKFRIIGVLTYI